MTDFAHFRTLLDSIDLKTLAPMPKDSEIDPDNKDDHPFSYCMAHVVPAIEKKNGKMDDPNAFCGWWKADRAASAALVEKIKGEIDSAIRQVHLRGATGQIRTAKYNGTDYLVVPVVALQEAVIHAVNAPEPEYVPLACLAVAPQGWNGRPCVLGHPVKDGRQISANSPGVLEKQGFGTIFGSKVEGKKLMLEAWIDPARAEKVGANDLVTRLRANQMCEVSVGAFVTTARMAGEFGGKAYTQVWRDIVPDHLAFLPKGIGACSIEMGCGAPRAAEAYQVNGDELIVLALPPWLQKKKDGTGDDPKTADDHTAKADAYDKQAKAAKDAGKTDDAEALAKKAKDHRDKAKAMRSAAYGDTAEEAASEEAAELISYQTMQTLLSQVTETLSAASDIVDELVADEAENPTVTPGQEAAEEEVETARLESLQVLCMSMYSSLNALMNLASDCLRPDAPQETAPRYMAGARHSATDRKIIQNVHDHSVSLGAECAADDRRPRYMAAALTGKSLDERMSAVSRAVETTYGSNMGLVQPSSYAYPQSIYDDHVIVRKGDKLYSVNYTTNKDGVVTFTGEPTEVKQEYVTAEAETMACTCQGGKKMTKEERSTLITSLVADKHSGFATGDEKMLEAASDERLDGFRTAAAARKTTEEEATRKAAVPPEPRQLSEDEFRKLAPDSLKSLIARQEAADTAHKAGLVATLVTAQKAYVEDELKAMSIETLEKLVDVAGSKQPEPVKVSYAGRPIPRVAEKQHDLTTPPNPYDEPLKAMRAAQGLPPLTPPTVQ